jgi:hypothetical protein
MNAAEDQIMQNQTAIMKALLSLLMNSPGNTGKDHSIQALMQQLGWTVPQEFPPIR